MEDEQFLENKIGIIGAGNMGRAIILKLLEKGYPYDNIELTYNGSIFTFSELYDNNLVDMISSNASIVENSSIIVLAVPPQLFSRMGEFHIEDDTLIVSIMAGISIDEIKQQTGSSNVVKIIPTGPDTIKNSQAIAGAYPSNTVANELFDLLDIDYYLLDNEDQMEYISIAGCLPAVFCKVDYSSEENQEAIREFAGDFTDFIEIAQKTSKLVPSENKDEFIKSFSTPGGITEAIIRSLDNGNCLLDSLNAGLERLHEIMK